MKTLPCFLGLLACLSVVGCAREPLTAPQVVDKGVPLSALTLADYRLGRHGAAAVKPYAQPNKTMTLASISTAQVFAASPKPALLIDVQPKLSAPKARPGALNELTAAPKVVAPAPDRHQIQMQIHKLTEGYIQGNLNDAHNLAMLLIQEKREEEADVVLDYASRQGHKPSMILLARRLKESGRQAEAQQWLERANAGPGKG